MKSPPSPRCVGPPPGFLCSRRRRRLRLRSSTKLLAQFQSRAASDLRPASGAVPANAATSLAGKAPLSLLKKVGFRRTLPTTHKFRLQKHPYLQTKCIFAKVCLQNTPFLQTKMICSCNRKVTLRRTSGRPLAQYPPEAALPQEKKRQSRGALPQSRINRNCRRGCFRAGRQGCRADR